MLGCINSLLAFILRGQVPFERPKMGKVSVIDDNTSLMGISLHMVYKLFKIYITNILLPFTDFFIKFLNV